jgi:hypothetical protein
MIQLPEPEPTRVVRTSICVCEAPPKGALLGALGLDIDVITPVYTWWPREPCFECVFDSGSIRHSVGHRASLKENTESLNLCYIAPISPSMGAGEFR